MKAFAIPTMCGALNAVGSLAFFGAFAYVHGDLSLARLVLVQAIVAVLQMALVPQCWLYVMSGIDPADTRDRFNASITLEAMLYVAGLMLLIAGMQTPVRPFEEYGTEALLFFAGLGLAGMTSYQGMLRAQERWVVLGAWMLLPTALRLVLIAFVASGTIAVPTDPAVAARWFVLVYFVVPEAIRFLAICVPIATFNWHRTTRTCILAAIRTVKHNWLFDVGGAASEHLDKVFVGLLVNPILFVVYFFARRIGAGISIAVEPFFAEMYRRKVRQKEAGSRSFMLRMLVAGNGMGLLVALAGTSFILLIRNLGAISTYIPTSVTANWWVFIALVMIDGVVAGTRWSRYVFQSGRSSLTFLIVRLALKLAFAAALLLVDTMGGAALVLAYGLVWMLEFAFVAVHAGHLDRAERAGCEPTGLPIAQILPLPSGAEDPTTDRT